MDSPAGTNRNYNLTAPFTFMNLFSNAGPGFKSKNPHIFGPTPTAPVEEEPRVSDAKRKWKKREEGKLHTDLIQDLQRRGWGYVHSRMDKSSTIRRGWPDFTVIHMDRVALVEFKAPGGSLSQDQKECIAELRRDGTPVLVTEDMGEAIKFLREYLE